MKTLACYRIVFTCLAVAFWLVGAHNIGHTAEDIPTVGWQKIHDSARPINPKWLDNEGNIHSLSQYNGKVVLINLWATWCVPCLREMPTLDALQHRYQAAGLMVVPIALDNAGFGKMSQFYRQIRIRHLPLAADPEGILLMSLATDDLPTTHLFDRTGKLVGTFTGAEDWMSPHMREKVEALLKQGYEQQEALPDPTMPPPMIVDSIQGEL